MKSKKEISSVSIDTQHIETQGPFTPIKYSITINYTDGTHEPDYVLASYLVEHHINHLNEKDKEQVLEEFKQLENYKHYDPVVNKLVELTKTYKEYLALKLPNIEFIASFLQAILKTEGRNSAWKIQCFYSFLNKDETKLANAPKNFEVIKNESSKYSLDFLEGVSAIFNDLAASPSSNFIIQKITGEFPAKAFKNKARHLEAPLQNTSKKPIMDNTKSSSRTANRYIFTSDNNSLEKNTSATLPQSAVDFYARIEYLINTTKQGFTDYSMQVGSISNLILPGKPNDHRSNYEKETAKLIDSLNGLEDLPETFFEKPFYCPFTELQFQRLKAQCCQKDPSSEGYKAEQKLIALYEKIIAKQEQVSDYILSDKDHFCKLTLESRIANLNQTLTKIHEQTIKLEKRAKNPKFFENASNADTKFKLLKTLENDLKTIKDGYDAMLHNELDPELNLFEYFQTTEESLHKSFNKAKKTASSELKTHSNVFMKLLDKLLNFITIGFGHITTKTESLITEANSSINHKF